MDRASTSDKKPPTYKPTLDAYDQWAQIYNTDGNFLQALDSMMMMKQILPVLTEALPSNPRIVDLGCGTGRTTSMLLRLPGVQLTGLDFSAKMLDVAFAECTPLWDSLPKSQRAATLYFGIYDMLDETLAIPNAANDADAVVSTLVIEHIPLETFFNVCSRMVKKRGVLVLTNMHPDMGAETQAGFTDPLTGEKVRPLSYVHTAAQTVEEARKWGFEVVWGPEERAVRADDLGVLGARARKWVGKKVWFGMVLRKV